MKVVTAVTNNTDFIEIQYYTLKKYLKNDFEFIVFNDAKSFPDFTNDGDVSIRTKIQEVCKNLGIECINIPNDHHIYMQIASARTADSLNYILQYQLLHPDEYLLLDSDMFLIDNLDISKYRNVCDTAFIPQTRDINGKRIEYLWSGIYYFNMANMKDLEMLNWGCGMADTGGMTHDWLEKQRTENRDDRIYLMKHLSSCAWDLTQLPENLRNKHELIEFMSKDPRNENGKFFSEIYDTIFFHYRAGGNWRREGIHNHKILTSVLKQILCK